jgi:hypothetical protein
VSRREREDRGAQTAVGHIVEVADWNPTTIRVQIVGQRVEFVALPATLAIGSARCNASLDLYSVS